ncbi:hypothetical protein [Spirosoma aerolatum]|uniref:hypothetical protein n=1 Tax=Spirosoma aerolatum TaxID=1211326 RepID=UPI0009AE8352|nr:hypothetical protein [Spirosoma aerolatum]
MILKVAIAVSVALCSACSSSYPVKASLERSTWFASGTPTTKKDLCSQERFNLFLKTDLPYPGSARTRSKKVTGCKGDCAPTQILTFTDIPLKQGYYDLSKPDLCSFEKVGAQGKYVVLGTSGMATQAYQKATGWIEITQYDQGTGLLEGKFDLSLLDSTGRVTPVHLSKGKIKVLVKRN